MIVTNLLMIWILIPMKKIRVSLLNLIQITYPLSLAFALRIPILAMALLLVASSHATTSAPS